jgi:competence protein ComEA
VATPTVSTPGGAPAAGSAGPTAWLVVQVVGEVRRPGLVRLPAGSRVDDAVRAAGGVRPGGGTGGLNLAREVVDGEQIVVAATAATGAPASTTGATSSSGGPAVTTVSLSTATLAELDALPGVGPVLAGRILAWRQAHGRFTSVDQLREVAGIGARTLDRLRPYLAP